LLDRGQGYLVTLVNEADVLPEVTVGLPTHGARGPLLHRSHMRGHRVVRLHPYIQMNEVKQCLEVSVLVKTELVTKWRQVTVRYNILTHVKDNTAATAITINIIWRKGGGGLKAAICRQRRHSTRSGITGGIQAAISQVG
jgi:hypothetical protein